MSIQHMKTNIAGEEITEGIAIFCPYMNGNFVNRKKNLKTAIKNWTSIDALDEIVILDWSSSEPLVFQHEKIKIIRVEGEKRWAQTKACNLAAQFTTKTSICKADVDHVLKEGFFEKYKPNKNSFFAGNYKLARNWNERFLNGLAYFKRDVFFSVNGYNESLIEYGYDDTDLYKRLEFNCISRLDIEPDDAEHIEHSDKDRGLEDNFWDDFPKNAPGFASNMQASKFNVWSEENQLTKYHIIKKDETFLCKRIPKQ